MPGRSNKCTWGPSYWCANIPQASECGAVKHCIGAVWTKEHVPQDDDEVCTICKDMVGQARDQLLSNQTQEELKEVFEGSCDLIPISIIAKECKKISDDFIVELVETLASEMDPDTVCTVAGLCNSARIDNMLEKLELKVGPKYGGDCNICKMGANKTKYQLKSLGQNQVEDKLLELCGYIGSFSDVCRETVITQSDMIYFALTNQFSDEICDLSGLCSQALEKVPATKVSSGEDIQCEFCEKVVKHWLDVYASNSSLAEFKVLLDGICEKLDKSNADHCKHIVDDYYIPAFKFLRNEIDPHTVCALVGLCGSGQFMQVGDNVPISLLSRKPPVSVPMVRLQPATPVRSKQALLVPGPAAPHNGLVPFSSKPKCEMCEYAMAEVFSIIKDKDDQEMIKNVLESICYRLPNSIEMRCDNFVEKYSGTILDFISNGLDADDICAALDLCETGQVMKPALKSQIDGNNCVLCEYVISTIDGIIEDKSNEEEIKSALETLCTILPSSISKQCDNFIETYTEIIIDMLTKDVTPEMICTNLGLCADKFTVIRAAPVVEDNKCILCEYVITTLDGMIEDKTNKKQIEDALESICSYLPGSIGKQCDTFVETYTDMIIDMLVKDVSPELICTNLGLCKKTHINDDDFDNQIENFEEQITDDEKPSDVKSPYCTLCELVVQDLEKTLADKKTEEEIENALDVLCSSLSTPVHKECEKMIAKYTEELVDLFLKDYTPKEICAELGLCVNNQINTNNIFEVDFDSSEEEDDSNSIEDVELHDAVGCEMCEFAMSIIDERLKDPTTINNLEREIQFVCSYLPGSIADRCETFVDKWGDKIINAVVDDEMNPKQVCSQLIPDCQSVSVGMGNCPWGKEYYCASPFHAKVCGATRYCQKTVWKKNGLY